MTKKILLIANEYTTIINFRMELVRALVDKGYIVGLALPMHERVKEIQAIGCTYFPLSVDRRSTNPLKDVKLLKDISKILKKFKPDIVFTFTIKPNVYGGLACTIQKTPYVATITGLGSSIQNGGLMRKISLKLYRLGLRKATKVFFQNQGNKDVFFHENIYKGESDVLPGSGVNVERFMLKPYPTDEIINFVYVGRVMKDKGVDELFEAAEYIRGKYPNTRFHVCGPCEETYNENLTELQKRGIIIYHGLIKDMAPIYEKIHCVVHPSYHEGMANVLLESAACGRPIIATNIFGCREAIDDGINGFRIESKNADSLKSALEKFILLPYHDKIAMGEAGRKKMEAEFDRKRVVQEYLRIIDLI